MGEQIGGRRCLAVDEEDASGLGQERNRGRKERWSVVQSRIAKVATHAGVTGGFFYVSFALIR